MVNVTVGDLLRSSQPATATNALHIPGGFGIGRRSKLATTLPSVSGLSAQLVTTRPASQTVSPDTW